MLAGTKRTFESAGVDMMENLINSNFLIETIAAAQKQNLFPFGNESRFAIIDSPLYFEKKDFTETHSTIDNSEPLTIESIIEISKRFTLIKPVKIFTDNNMAIRKRILEKYPKTKKKRIIKKFMKKYGRTIEIPSPDLFKVETNDEIIYMAHPDTIKKAFADLQPMLKEHQYHTMGMPLCEIFGLKF